MRMPTGHSSYIHKSDYPKLSQESRDGIILVTIDLKCPTAIPSLYRLSPKHQRSIITRTVSQHMQIGTIGGRPLVFPQCLRMGTRMGHLVWHRARHQRHRNRHRALATFSPTHLISPHEIPLLSSSRFCAWSASQTTTTTMTESLNGSMGAMFIGFTIDAMYVHPLLWIVNRLLNIWSPQTVRDSHLPGLSIQSELPIPRAFFVESRCKHRSLTSEHFQLYTTKRSLRLASYCVSFNSTPFPLPPWTWPKFEQFPRHITGCSHSTLSISFPDIQLRETWCIAILNMVRLYYWFYDA